MESVFADEKYIYSGSWDTTVRVWYLYSVLDLLFRRLVSSDDSVLWSFDNIVFVDWDRVSLDDPKFESFLFEWGRKNVPWLFEA